MSDKRNRGAGVDRRYFIGSSVAAASLLASGALRRAWAQDTRLATQSKAVQTTSGSIQGVVLDGGVNAFYGVPYGASTAGANRFMPPQKPTPWTGVKETTLVGYRSPQGAGPIPEVEALDRQEPMSEDCLDLNVFTPALGRGDRPVMVWLHGGGFTSGSGNWLLYDGARLARSQDVVVVPVTHRLNVFGYLYLEEIGGEQFKGASNVGMLDIIAALQWVRDNIAQFGGNPNNVTIFGQSGGGGKVGALLGMTPAKGLFQKAIGMSGAFIQGVPKDRATETAQKFMASVGAKTVADLQKMPTEQLRTGFINTQGLAMSPVVDGHTLPANPFAPTASPLSAGIPLMMGTTEHEVNFFPGAVVDPIEDADLFARVKQAVRADDAKVKEVIDLYRHNRPNVSNVELYQIIASDNSFRVGPMTQTERKAEQATAPVYQYYFRWQSVIRDGKLRAFHTLDIPFAFNNVEVATAMTGTAQSRYALATKVSSAFASFARTGNPNTGGLPNWPQFDTKTRATMAFNNDCEVLDDPYRDERLLLAQLREGAARNG
jgi:para-nitrobenzyl esterase